MHQQHNQAGVVNKQKKALFTTPVSQITYLRQRGTFTTRTSDRLDAVTAGLAWCRAVEYSDRCRKYRYLRHRCRKYLIYDTTARSRHTRRFGQTLPRVFWYGVQLSLKLSCTRNGLVLDEIRRILVHQQHNQTGVVNSVIYDTGVANTLFMTPRNVHDTHAGLARRCHGKFGML